MPQSDRMAQLVGHDVASNIGEPKRWVLKAKSDETFVRLLKGHDEGIKGRVRQRNDQILFNLDET
jgi:hypothetical protein